MVEEEVLEILGRKPSLRPYWVAIAALITSLVAVATLVSMALRDRVHFTVKEPVKVLTPVVRAGHSVTLLFDYCKTGHDIATVGTLLARRGVMVPLSLWPSDLPVGCHTVAVTLPIPAYVSGNTYVLYLVREYRPTVFNTRGVSFRSEPFQVLPYDGSVPAPIPFDPQREDPKYDTHAPPGTTMSPGANAPWRHTP